MKSLCPQNNNKHRIPIPIPFAIYDFNFAVIVLAFQKVKNCFGKAPSFFQEVGV